MCIRDRDKKDRADSANDFRELLRVVRVGDRLNMDGLEAMKMCIRDSHRPAALSGGRKAVGAQRHQRL